MVADALDSDFENGVADVLAFLARDRAVVERNVHVQGRLSGTSRQIDIRVTGDLFGLARATMIVDCKRYNKPLDVNHVGQFATLVNDVGADIGLLVATKGATPAAQNIANSERGIRVEVMSLDQLAGWSPRGTVHFDYAIPQDRYEKCTSTARRAGFRVKPVEVPDWRNLPGHRGLTAFRHFGVTSPSWEIQEAARDDLIAAFKKAGVAGDDAQAMGNGVVVSGGTPSHRWLKLTIGGVPVELRVLASTEEEIDEQISLMLPSFPGLTREMVDVVRPDPWPIPTPFPAW